jgi:hypothetical protein
VGKYKLKSAHDALKDPRLSSVADDRALDRKYTDRQVSMPPPPSKAAASPPPTKSAGEDKANELKRMREEREKREQKADKGKRPETENERYVLV